MTSRQFVTILELLLELEQKQLSCEYDADI